jgi:hypothetical protein
MKKVIETYQQFLKFLLLLVSLGAPHAPVHAQKNKLNKFLTANDSKYTFFIDLKDRSGIVFVLEEWMDKGFGGYRLIFSDTLQRQDATAAYRYVGKSMKIQNEGGRAQLIFTGETSKPERLKIDTAYIQGDVLFKINNAYWWSGVVKVTEEINNKFPLHHYSFRNGLAIREGFRNKETDYGAFKKFADQKILAIRDSVERDQVAHTKITEDIVANISTMSYETLKDYTQKLPIEYETEYFSVVVNAICMNRPEFFFRLADELPKKKQQLFDAVDTNRIILKKLSDAPINSPSKNEFFRIK